VTVKNYDLVVIGSGSAGSLAAYRCRSAGWNVAVVDSQPFGGTCALRGCDPKKVLVGAAELVDWNMRMKGRGVSGDAAIDWPGLMRFKRTFTDPVPREREKSFAEEGIAAFHARVRFLDESTLAGGEDLLTARHFVIAAGAKPVPLHIPGEEFLTTSTQFLELEKLPKKIVFVGGGYIAFEFANIAARAGAEVTIVNRGDRPLKGFDPDLVDELARGMKEFCISIRNKAAVKAIPRLGIPGSRQGGKRLLARGSNEPHRRECAVPGGRVVRGSLRLLPEGAPLEKKSGRLVVRASSSTGEQALDADIVVHSAGRAPDIDDMDLEKGGIKREAKGITVNEYLQSVSNPAVYAAGDAAASGLPLTPSAALEADTVSRNLREGNRYKPDYRGIATVVYSVPPLAAVGLSERAAREQGLEFDVKSGNTSDWFNLRRVGADCGGFKVLTEKGSRRILGAHLLGPQADEIINIFAMAVRFGLSASEIKDIPFAYPTHSYDTGYML
jgi:glutathione reductase (NADPH)